MEALIAVAIMTIGLLAILSFFPLAAYQMGQAFKDERSTALAVNSDQLFRTIWRESGLLTDTDSNFKRAFTEIIPTHYVTTTPPVARQSGSLIDPIGIATSSSKNWVAGQESLIPRRTLRVPFNGGSFADATIQSRVRYTTLTDDISFTPSGVPDASSGEDVERGDRYNCSWFISDTNPSAPGRCELKVLVFENRPAKVGDPSLEVPASVSGVVFRGQSAASIDSGALAMPGLKSGKWVMLINKTVYKNASNQESHYVDSAFVRASGVTRGGGNQYTLDFDQPVSADFPNRTGFTSQTAFAIVFENLVEVFDRGLVER